MKANVKIKESSQLSASTASDQRGAVNASLPRLAALPKVSIIFMYESGE
jgi:hypothetical protein